MPPDPNLFVFDITRSGYPLADRRYTTSDVATIVFNPQRLASLVGDRSRPLMHVRRARIVVLLRERLPALAVR